MYSNIYYHIKFLTNHISRKVFLNMHHHYSLSLGQDNIKTELLFLFHTSLQYLATICFKNVFLGQCLIFLQKSSTIPSIWFDPNIGLFVNEGDSLELSIKQHPFSREGGRREWLKAHPLDKTKIINLSFFTCILIDTFTICVFIYVLCVWGRQLWHGILLEVREQLYGADSLLQLLCKFQGSNSCPQACVSSAVFLWVINQPLITAFKDMLFIDVWLGRSVTLTHGGQGQGGHLWCRKVFYVLL